LNDKARPLLKRAGADFYSVVPAAFAHMMSADHMKAREADVMLHILLETLASKFLFFALHLSSTGSFPPPLSPEEEQRCLLAYAAGDAAARDKLIEHNLRLVVHVIKKYYANCVDQEDLISVGTIGLIKAINTFNVGKGARLATYAARCIDKTTTAVRLRWGFKMSNGHLFTGNGGATTKSVMKSRFSIAGTVTGLNTLRCSFIAQACSGQGSYRKQKSSTFSTPRQI
jgi:RNA polymerase sporulation-specific sigma factor